MCVCLTKSEPFLNETDGALRAPNRTLGRAPHSNPSLTLGMLRGKKIFVYPVGKRSFSFGARPRFHRFFFRRRNFFYPVVPDEVGILRGVPKKLARRLFPLKNKLNCFCTFWNINFSNITYQSLLFCLFRGSGVCLKEHFLNFVLSILALFGNNISN